MIFVHIFKKQWYIEIESKPFNPEGFMKKVLAFAVLIAVVSCSNSVNPLPAGSCYANIVASSGVIIAQDTIAKDTAITKCDCESRVKSLGLMGYPAWIER